MSEEIRKPELPIKLEPLVEKVIKLYTELPEERVEEVNAALVPYLESVGVLCDNLPPLIKGTSNAVKAMKKWTAIESDEDEEDVRVLLGKVKESYEVNSDRRKKITAPADALKDFLMPFEKSVSSDSKEPNEYNRLKGLIVQRQQKKLDEKRRQEAEAARKKAIENHKIDLKLQLQKQLSQMVIDIISRTDSGCKKFWDETTLENFEVNEKKFRSMKVKLKDADFNSYYTFNYDKNLLSDSEFNAFIEDVKKEETFDKWNIEIVEKCTPIVNEWIEKIPEIKLNKEQLAEAASEEEKARLAREQKDKADLDEKRRRQQLEAQQKLIDKENEEKASMDKMENEFGEQIAVQSLGDAGLSKKVLRFKSDRDFPKAFAKIIYHCILDKKFPGIYKLTKDKKPVLDSMGRPEYRDEIKWWLTMFTAGNHDVEIEGIEFVEDSKVIIRK